MRQSVMAVYVYERPRPDIKVIYTVFNFEQVHEIVIRPAECIVSLGKEQTDEKRGEGETDIADEESEVQENAVEADVE